MALMPSVIMASIAIRCLPAFNAITAKYFVPAIKIKWIILILEMNVKMRDQRLRNKNQRNYLLDIQDYRARKLFPAAISEK